MSVRKEAKVVGRTRIKVDCLLTNESKQIRKLLFDVAVKWLFYRKRNVIDFSGTKLLLVEFTCCFTMNVFSTDYFVLFKIYIV